MYNIKHMINFSYSGRATISEFFKVSIIGFTVSFIGKSVSFLLERNISINFYLDTIITILILLMVLPTTVRRLHDRDKSGLFAMISVFLSALLILMVDIVPLFVLMILSSALFIYNIFVFFQLISPGINGPNKYGDDPKISSLGLDSSNPGNSLNSYPVTKKTYSLISLVINWILYIPVAGIIFFIAMLLTSGHGTTSTQALIILSLGVLVPLTFMIIYTIVMVRAIRNEKRENNQISQNLSTPPQLV